MMDDNLMAYMAGQNENGRNNGIFGGDGLWGLIIILALLGGFGGGFGFGGFGGGMMFPWMMGGWGRDGNCATQADLAAGFNNSAVLNNLNDLKLGQAGIQQAMGQGFAGVDKELCDLGYRNQQGFFEVSRQIGDCCCENRAAIQDLKYTISKEGCDTRRALEDGTRAILERLAQSDYNQLKEKYDTAQMKLVQAEQNRYFDATLDATKAEILRRSGYECPVNAVVVQPSTPVSFRQGCGQTCGQACGNYGQYGFAA